MNYSTMHDIITRNYDEYIDKIALIFNYHRYYADDNFQEAILGYGNTYDNIVSQIIENVHSEIMYEYHVGLDSRRFKDYFTDELKDLKHILSTGFFDFLYNIFYDSYAEKYIFDDLDASWLEDIYNDELKENKEFKEFVNCFS